MTANQERHIPFIESTDITVLSDASIVLSCSSSCDSSSCSMALTACNLSTQSRSSSSLSSPRTSAAHKRKRSIISSRNMASFTANGNWLWSVAMSWRQSRQAWKCEDDWFDGWSISSESDWLDGWSISGGSDWLDGWNVPSSLEREATWADSVTLAISSFHFLITVLGCGAVDRCQELNV